MVGHGVYGALGPRRAVLERSTYELLRGLGFDGVAITDSLDVVGSADQDAWARQALLAGADLLLFTNGRDAASAVDALVPLARLGALDAHVLRALKFRDELGRSP
jgi:beta-N-acetylhexosaminidase